MAFNVWAAIARAESVITEAWDGKISDLNRTEIIAQCQADQRRAGGTLADQQKCRDELDPFIDEHNESVKRTNPIDRALKTGLWLVGIGVVTFAAVKALK